MALSEQQIEQVIDYVNVQILTLVERSDADITDDKDVQRLYIMISRLYEELGKTMTDYLPPAIYDAYIEGLRAAEQSLELAGLGAVVASQKGFEFLTEAPIHKEAIANVVTDTMDDLAAAFRTAEIYGQQELNYAIDDVRTELANGLLSGMTTKQITQRVGQKFGDIGMTSFVTKDGKHLPLDFYAKTVTRTKLQTAKNHGHLNRYKDRKVKHVYVTGNIPTCAKCASYRNIVFATEPGDDFPHVDLHKLFPLHPNCRCTFRPYIMKFKSDEEIQREKDKATMMFDPDNDVRTKAEAKKYDAQQKAKQKARKQRLTFNKMKAQLGDDGPQTLKEFKNASKAEYHDWVAQMKKMYDPHKQHEPRKEKPTPPKKIEPEVDETNEPSVIEYNGISLEASDSEIPYTHNVSKAMERVLADNDYNIPMQNNYVNLLNNLTQDVGLFEAKKGAYYHPYFNNVYMTTKAMKNIIDDDKDPQNTFAHEYGHAIDQNFFDLINDRRQKGTLEIKGRNILDDRRNLHNMFEGLDLEDYITAEVMHNAIDRHASFDAKDFNEYLEVGGFTGIAKKHTDDRFKMAEERTGRKLKRDEKTSIRRHVKAELMDALEQYAKNSNLEYRELREQGKGHVKGLEQDMLDSFGARSIFGHGKTYWKRWKLKTDGATARGKEAFAEISETLSNKETYDEIAKNFPQSLSVYQQILEEAQKYIQE